MWSHRAWELKERVLAKTEGKSKFPKKVSEEAFHVLPFAFIITLTVKGHCWMGSPVLLFNFIYMFIVMYCKVKKMCILELEIADGCTTIWISNKCWIILFLWEVGLFFPQVWGIIDKWKFHVYLSCTMWYLIYTSIVEWLLQSGKLTYTSSHTVTFFFGENN